MRRLIRSPREVAYRIRQETANLALWAWPPRLPPSFHAPAPPLAGLPDPARIAALLRPTSFPEQLRHWARLILDHRIPLFGHAVETGPHINWRRDYLRHRQSAAVYFRRIPYLDFARVGDHKVIWELNRHQHLVLLAQAALFDDDPSLRREIWKELESWIDDNPFQRGINWASALEVGLRALSWSWIYHLAGREMPGSLRPRFFEILYRHGWHLAVNLSFFFSPNTHLLGEAVALHALGLWFPQFPEAASWARLGARVVEEQMRRQVRADGGHVEQSTCYHVYALDMFLFHAILAEPSPEFRAGLARMVDYLGAMLGPSGCLPSLGDDDGGRFFFPFGRRDRFGRATLAVAAQYLDRHDWTYSAEDLHPLAAWWLGRADSSGAGKHASRFFPATGSAVMTAGPHHVVIDAGPFGPWGAGHSHADTLSLVVRSGDDEILIDPGAYTYVADPSWRDWFRGTAAHNTVRIDGKNQAAPAGPFRWTEQPHVEVRAWSSTPAADELDAVCRIRGGFSHRRRVRFLKPALLLVVDEILGLPGERLIEQFWHLGSPEARRRLVLEEPVEELAGWRSPVFTVKEPVPTLCVRRRARLPVTLAAGVLLEPDHHLEISRAGESIVFRWRRPDGETVTMTT